MLSVSKLLDSAVARHRAGRLGEAEALYKQILLIEPGHADSLHLLGVLAGEVGHHEVAARLISQAIRRRPADPLYYRNLGVVMHRVGRFGEAVVCYSKALEIEPNHAETMRKLARSLSARGWHQLVSKI